ncbi:hypothetical protein AB0M29_43615 [Streptomyces sp. NPDC051976]|uniref:hypothetical protein n=1 Tax=Streptomyces sp. NPDC051976 TaxID=3154947 RepID=UPI0034122B1B
MTQRRRGLGRRRTIILVAVPAAGLALTAAVVIAHLLERIWNGHPYPVAAPAATARRLDARTQAVYDALGLPRTELADYGTGWDADVDDCPRHGLRHLPDGLRDSGIPSEPQTVKISDRVALQGIPSSKRRPPCSG